MDNVTSLLCSAAADALRLSPEKPTARVGMSTAKQGVAATGNGDGGPASGAIIKKEERSVGERSWLRTRQLEQSSTHGGRGVGHETY